jgi:hypothetical protein
VLLDVDRMPAKIPVIISTVSGSGLSLMDKGGHVDGMSRRRRDQPERPVPHGPGE